MGMFFFFYKENVEDYFFSWQFISLFMRLNVAKLFLVAAAGFESD